MAAHQRGEVWLVDLGLAAKVRPCLVISSRPEGDERALVTLIPHTTSPRSTRFEAVVPAHFLRVGAFDAQGIVTVPTVRLIRRLGALTADQLEAVVGTLCDWLGIKHA